MNSESFLTFFCTINLALGGAILIYLRHFLSYRKIAARSSITTFVPILTPLQSRFFITGFALWTAALAFDALHSYGLNYLPQIIQRESTFLIDVIRPGLLMASTMYLGHALMFFAALPVREGQRPPNLKRIKYYRRTSLLVLTVITLYVLFQGPNQLNERVNWVDVQRFGIILQWVIILHVFSMIRHSIHPLQKTILWMMPVWMLHVPMEMGRFAWKPPYGDSVLYLWSFDLPSQTVYTALITTVFLFAFLSLLLRANFLYVEETFRRANALKNEKEVMISFLQKVNARATTLDESESKKERNEPGDIENPLLDLDLLMGLTLEFGMELCNASAGVMFVRDDIHEVLSNPLYPKQKGIFLSPLAIQGPYPPTLNLGRLPVHQQSRIEYVHDLVRSEKIALGEGTIGSLALKGESLLIADASGDERVPQQEEEFLKVKTMLAIPLNVQDVTVAVLSLVNKKESGALFSTIDQATLEAMTEQAAITLGSAFIHDAIQERDRLEREIRLASEVQQLLLPKTCPRIDGYDIGAISDPAQNVGGDYYDFIWLDEKRLAIVVADVSGKGAAGAMTMATVRSALRALSRQESNARQLLIDLNQFLLPDLGRDTFISMMLAILDTGAGELDIARAGHEPLLLLRQDTSTFLHVAPSGIALGLVNGDVFNQFTQLQTIRIDEGDSAVLYTDGITEAFDPSLQEFTLERFLDTIREHRSDGAQDIVDATRKRVTDFAGEMPQHDDYTMVVIKRV